jgi:YHS domain-containing protein
MIRAKLSLCTFVCVLALASVSLFACGGNQAPYAAPSSPSSPSSPAAPSAAGAAAPKGAAKEAGDAKVGDTTRCPVSGEEFTVEASSPKVEHDGKTYYFCCAGCKKKFEADPSKFTKKS